MSGPASPPPTQGLPGLLAEALRGAGDVVRGEIALLRQEMGDTLRRVIVGLAAMAAAAVFAVVGLLVLIDAAVKGLAIVLGSEALSALIIGVVFLIFGIVLALVARSRFSLDALVPTRTGRQLKQDAKVISEHANQ